MRDLGALRNGAVRGSVGGDGIGACTLGSIAWGRGCSGAVLVGMVTGVLVVMVCTLGSVSGWGGCLGCVCGLDVAIFSIW